MAVAANSTGIIILGGGVAKHHICNANAFVSVVRPGRATCHGSILKID